MFYNCPDDENFSGYDAIFVSALAANGHFCDALCLDVNCRYQAHFKNHHPVYAAMIPTMLVGWLHSNAGHNLSCQLKFCGMYYESMGRCIGEQPEQLWVSCGGIAHHVLSLICRVHAVGGIDLQQVL